MNRISFEPFVKKIQSHGLIVPVLVTLSSRSWKEQNGIVKG